jgi:hypothetical protein
MRLARAFALLGCAWTSYAWGVWSDADNWVVSLLAWLALGSLIAAVVLALTPDRGSS